MVNLTQDQIRAKMQRLDDVFHRMMVALERLEIYTEAVRLDGRANCELITTAVRTDRDLHDDERNPPSRNSFLGEIQLQLSALYFQTKIDDKETFTSAVKYFLGDLLEWYGGRGDSIPFNEVDAFVLPIIVSLNQQVKNVAEIMQVVEKYVAVIPGISSYNDDEKAEAIAQSMETLIEVIEHNHEKSHHESSEGEVEFTIHKRGDKGDGYKRLINAMLQMYDEVMPAIVVFRTVSNYLPEVSKAVPSVSEGSIEEFIASKDAKDNSSNENDSFVAAENSDNPIEQKVTPIITEYEDPVDFEDMCLDYQKKDVSHAENIIDVVSSEKTDQTSVDTNDDTSVEGLVNELDEASMSASLDQPEIANSPTKDEPVACVSESHPINEKPEVSKEENLASKPSLKEKFLNYIK